MTATVVDVDYVTPDPDNAEIRVTFPNPELLSDVEIHGYMDAVDRHALLSNLSPAAERFLALCVAELNNRARRAVVNVDELVREATGSADDLEALYVEAIARLEDAAAAIEAVQSARPGFEAAWSSLHKLASSKVPPRPSRFAGRVVAEPQIRDLSDRMKAAFLGGW